MQEDLKNLKVSIEDGVCTITLNRPKQLNVFNEETLNEFKGLLDRISVSEETKVVCILSASEKALTAGADITQMVDKDEAGGRAFAVLGHSIARKLETMPQPVIIGIRGYAFGGGVEFSCACDIRIATENAIISQPEIDIGVLPGWGGTQRLARIVGIAKAKEMIFTGKRIDAKEALDIGLVNHVVANDKLEEAVITMAKIMAAKGKLALFACKSAINQIHESFIIEGLAFEIDRWTELFSTYDQKEGMKAFLERRLPEFKDR